MSRWSGVTNLIHFGGLPVVWLLLEPHGTAIVEVCGELGGCALAQSIDRGRHLLLGNAFKLSDVMEGAIPSHSSSIHHQAYVRIFAASLRRADPATAEFQ